MNRRRERRRRQIRRRRAFAAAALLASGAGIAAAVLVTRGGPTPPQAAATTSAPVVRPLPSRPKPHPGRRPSQLAALIGQGIPVYCGGLHGNKVALTFDDGPGAYTSLAIKILHRYRARATFFLVGRNLASWPGLPERELELGELGDHTWTHRDLAVMRQAEMSDELARTQKAIAGIAHRPIRLFRPPYGAHNSAVDAESQRLGMLEVLWSVDSADSAGLDYDGIQKLVLRRIRPGSIVLMHENRGQTIRALKFYVLPALRRRGLHPVTVPELLDEDPPTQAQLRAGWKGCYPS